MLNSFIWPIDRTPFFATTLGQSGPGNDGNEGILYIPKSSCITEALPSDCLVSYPGHSLNESAEMQSVYSTAPTNWTYIWWWGFSFGDLSNEKFSPIVIIPNPK